jgi:hypothetical protein
VYEYGLFPGNALPGIAQLSKLTSLALAGEVHECDEPLQQLLAQPLPLRQLQLDTWDSGALVLPVLDMTNMTQLQELSSTSLQLHQDTALPHQLQRLAFGICKHGTTLAVASRCQQLQYVSCCVRFIEPEPLLQLAALPALRHVALDFRSWREAAGTLPAWTQLPLQQLSVSSRYDYGPLDGAAAAAADQRRLLMSVMAGVSACTRLTELHLNLWAAPEVHPMPDLLGAADADEYWAQDDSEDLQEGGSESEEDAEQQQQLRSAGQAGRGQQKSSYSSIVCGSLVCLASLKNLEVTYRKGRLAFSDVAALTALSGMTRLAVPDVLGGEGAGCVAAVLQRWQDYIT